MNEETRTWNVRDNVLKEYSLESIVDCTREDDVISLQTKKVIKTEATIVIRWALTITGPTEQAEREQNGNQKASLTCPESQGLFLIR